MVKYLIQPFSIDHYEMGMIAKPKIISEEEFLKLKESYQFIKLGILSDYEFDTNFSDNGDLYISLNIDGQIPKYGTGFMLWEQL